MVMPHDFHNPNVPRLVGSGYAAYVLKYHYLRIYGPGLLRESPRSLRVKIQELESQLEPVRHQRGAAYHVMVRNITNYERIAQLLEMLPRF